MEVWGAIEDAGVKEVGEDKDLVLVNDDWAYK